MPVATTAAPLVVTLDFVDNCWVETRVDGQRERHQQEYTRGESLRLEAQESVELSLGNLAGVQVLVNGRPYALPQRGTSRVARGLRIDLETARTLAGEP